MNSPKRNQRPLREFASACADLLKSTDCIDVEISNATDDSREVKADTLFVAVRGVAADGNDWIAKAIDAGASAIVSHLPAPANGNTPWLQLREGGPEIDREAVARIAACQYGEPAKQLKLIGITGTNGKTTTACIIQHLLAQAEIHAGRIGTIGAQWDGRTIPLSHTTPPPFQLQEILRKMVDDGVTAVVMETSSHALHQHRIGDLKCDVAVFTHLTQDHLDYHGTLEHCFAAKSLLFTKHLATDGTAVINGDCPWGQELAQEVDHPHTWGRSDSASFQLIGEPKFSAAETAFQLRLPNGETQTVVSPLIGAFNVDNAIAAIGAVMGLGISAEHAIRGLRSFAGVPGRMQRLPIVHKQIVVDYAHTDDALDNALRTLRPITEGCLICVFGCGGDRDRSKRPKMAAAAAKYADLCILTSDNPRTEDPESILNDVEAGMPPNSSHGNATYLRIADRRQAIAAAIQSATSQDLILIAGKGHEDYQEIHGIRHPFSDAQVAIQEAQ